MSKTLETLKGISIINHHRMYEFAQEVLRLENDIYKCCAKLNINEFSRYGLSSITDTNKLDFKKEGDVRYLRGRNYKYLCSFLRGLGKENFARIFSEVTGYSEDIYLFEYDRILGMRDSIENSTGLLVSDTPISEQDYLCEKVVNIINVLVDILTTKDVREVSKEYNIDYNKLKNKLTELRDSVCESNLDFHIVDVRGYMFLNTYNVTALQKFFREFERAEIERFSEYIYRYAFKVYMSLNNKDVITCYDILNSAEININYLNYDIPAMEKLYINRIKTIYKNVTGAELDDSKFDIDDYPDIGEVYRLIRHIFNFFNPIINKLNLKNNLTVCQEVLNECLSDIESDLVGELDDYYFNLFCKFITVKSIADKYSNDYLIDFINRELTTDAVEHMLECLQVSEFSDYLDKENLNTVHLPDNVISHIFDEVRSVELDMELFKECALIALKGTECFFDKILKDLGIYSYDEVDVMEVFS